jgi:hypothetical protein
LSRKATDIETKVDGNRTYLLDVQLAAFRAKAG